MEKSTLISEMQKFHFGSKILCSDGEEGTLTQVALEPTTRRLTGIAVKQGRFFGKTVFLPSSTIVDATSNGVTLNITRAELADQQNTLNGVILDGRTVVQMASSGSRGALLLLAFYPENHEISYCVAHQLRPGQDTLLRGEFLTSIENDRIVVEMPDATFQTLPPYRSDEELQREVESILFDLTPLHVDFKGMQVRVLDSVLYLDGNISSTLRGDIVESQALGVPGLLEFKNRLIADDTLAGNLAMALSRDSRTHDLPIGVYPRLGNVRLSGAVHSNEQKQAATEIASSFPGVSSVTNDLVVNPQEDMLRVMASAEGGETEDKVPGKYIRHTK